MDEDDRGGIGEWIGGWIARVRLGLAVLCLAGAGASAGYAMQPAPETPPAPASEVTVGGLAVDLDAAPEREAERLAAAFLAERITLAVDDRTMIRRRRALGAGVDLERLRGWLEAARDPRSPLRTTHAREHGDAPIHIPMPVTLDRGPGSELLLPLKDVIDRAPVEARMDTAKKVPRPGRDGRRLDVWATLDRLEQALADGERRIAAVIVRRPPERTSESLADASMEAVLGRFETPYDLREKAADRTHNLEVAAEKIDGLVLQPGEVFDFNEVVGDRNEANGFRPATVIAGGELVDGVGGGACQIAGTLHAAAFFAGLAVEERHPHSRPSTYIKLGLDAAVSYPKLNLRLRNDLDHPVVLQITVSGGETKAAVWGPERDKMVTFVRRIDEATPFEEKVIEDEDLPEGVRVVTQRGVPGFELTRWRIVRDPETRQAIRTGNEDEYPPTTRIVRLGTGEPPPEGYEPPEGDTHPEYVADEYLTMTQGPGIDGTLERRRAGRTGSYGWTEREGLTPEAADGESDADDSAN